MAAEKTYTLAYRAGLLIAVVPDGADVAAAVAAEGKRLKRSLKGYKTMSGLVLADSMPVGGVVFWRGHGMRWLKDETGRSFRYAVLPSAKLL